MKICTGCKLGEDEVEFNQGYSRCKDCHKKYMKEYNKKNKENNSIYYQNNRDRILKYKQSHYENNLEKYSTKNQNNYMKHKDKIHEKRRVQKYNMSQEYYEQLQVLSDGKCNICGNKVEILNIDHNHDTGKVRGLLCSNCNLGLGHFKDNVSILINAIEYLKERDYAAEEKS